MPCWDHDAVKKPANVAGFSRRGPLVFPLGAVAPVPPGALSASIFVSGRCLPVVASLLPPGTALTRRRFAPISACFRPLGIPE